MILMSDRRAEKGQDPVAHDPVHGALVAVDCLNHAFEHRIEELLCSLGVAVRKHLHRTLDIGEQNGDLFALALEPCPCAQDLDRQGAEGCNSWARQSGDRPEQALRDGHIRDRTWQLPAPRIHSCRKRAPAELHTGRRTSPQQCSRARSFGHFIVSKSGAECATNVASRTIGNKQYVPFEPAAKRDAARDAYHLRLPAERFRRVRTWAAQARISPTSSTSMGYCIKISRWSK